MLRFFLKLWPVLLPLVVYFLWLQIARNRARKSGEEILPGIGDGPWVWSVIASLVVGVAMFLFMGLSATREQGIYVPSHVENGKLIDGKVIKH